jgi:uncharacterized membrane protein YbhN (UPF0104 family)
MQSPRAARTAFDLLGKKADNLRDAWIIMIQSIRSDWRQAALVGLQSLLIWYLHLVQIWLFIVALGASVPLGASLGLTSLAILAGLVPVTLAGIGARDAALILFYRGYFGEPTGVMLGLLCTLRYVLPALAGLPFLRGVMAPAQCSSSVLGVPDSRPSTRS